MSGSMPHMRAVIVGILCASAAGASAQSFEQQLFQFSHNASVMTRQTRQAYSANAQAAAVQGQAAWHKVTGPDGTFTAEMPAAPNYTIQGAFGGDGFGHYLQAHTYILMNGARSFIIQTAIYPPETDTSNPQATLQLRMNSGAVNMDGGKWISVTWAKHQGLAAFDAVGLAQGREIRFFVVMRGQQVFQMFYSAPDGTIRSEEVNRFIASLKIR